MSKKTTTSLGVALEEAGVLHLPQGDLPNSKAPRSTKAGVKNIGINWTGEGLALAEEFIKQDHHEEKAYGFAIEAVRHVVKLGGDDGFTNLLSGMKARLETLRKEPGQTEKVEVQATKKNKTVYGVASQYLMNRISEIKAIADWHKSNHSAVVKLLADDKTGYRTIVMQARRFKAFTTQPRGANAATTAESGIGFDQIKSESTKLGWADSYSLLMVVLNTMAKQVKSPNGFDGHMTESMMKAHETAFAKFHAMQGEAPEQKQAQAA